MGKMRKAALALAVGMIFCAGAAAESSPLLYEVTGREGQKIYLLGTIHLGAESMYPFSEPVQRAYEDADIIAVEMDIAAFMDDPLKMGRYALALNLSLFDSAKNHLSPETYDLGMEKINQPGLLLSRLHPQGWIAFAQEQSYARIGQSKEWGADLMLLRQARQDHKRIDEVEGLDDQIKMVLSIPDAVADYQLKQLLQDESAADALFEETSRAWAAGDAEEMKALLQRQRTVPPELQEAYAAYDQRFYALRDDGMEEKAVRYLENGDRVLFAVGIAHIIGENALAERLEGRGYTVREIGRE